ncbi:PREDICTED: peroxidase 27-like [Tarenaya hassleriana]|uniref:peroxidase 27-like n=1 Tax=Tarenaya hassleriana TaxID=28532 RepID=UPI00053C43A6|nr:PREDICTED: peroxidase 27-like [Tarenaya hassleriana]
MTMTSQRCSCMPFDQHKYLPSSLLSFTQKQTLSEEYSKRKRKRMAASKIVSLLFFLQLISLLCFSVQTDAKGLKLRFYDKTCPKAELIVRKIVSDAIKKAPTLAAPLLRMFFHDCFVRGCDGSVLLDRPKGEKSAIPNLSLRGFHIIDKAKKALEKECPGIVSCSDILALVSRDAVAAIHGPFWEVETGRRDGRVTSAAEALLNLPSPFDDVSSLISQFHSKGLDLIDLVVLSGGHTIGNGHCPQITNRLYNFTGKGDSDPSLDSEYADRLRQKCEPADLTTALEMDPGSFRTFDKSYYTLVSKRRGLFQSDAALLDHPEARAYVLRQARPHGSTFFKDFGVSMVRMGRVGVLTGRAGEVRKMCRMVN